MADFFRQTAVGKPVNPPAYNPVYQPATSSLPAYQGLNNILPRLKTTKNPGTTPAFLVPQKSAVAFGGPQGFGL